MDVRRRAWLYLSACFLLCAASPLDGAETLRDAWTMAATANQQLEAARQDVQAARFDLSAARRAYAPSVSTTTYYNMLSDRVGPRMPGPTPTKLALADRQFVVNSTQATMPLYTGGKIRSSVAANGASVRAAESDCMTETLDLKMSVVEAYVRILRAQWSVRTARSSVDSLKAHERDVENMLKQELIARNDLLAVRVQRADAEQCLLQARNAHEIAIASYNRLLGRPMDRPVDLQDLEASDVEYSVDALTERALRRRPELAALAAQAESLQYRADIETSDLRPQAQVSGGLTYLGLERIDPNAIADVSFQVRWAPIDGGVAQRKSASLRRQGYAACKRRADAETRVALEVRSLWLSLRENRRRIAVTGEAIEQAEENLRITRGRFVQGVGSNTEVLDADTLRTRSYDNYYNAVYDAVLSEFRLLRAVGDL